MQGSSASSDAIGGSARDVDASRVENFFGPAVKLAPTGDKNDTLRPTDFVPYFNGAETFMVQFGTPGAGSATTVWTDEEGIRGIIRSLQETLGRVERARSGAERDSA